ncbi:hypothetical protein CDD83_1608 [Cordyceps sp. RAO-2017]|nr:hypothetical protein CDD83_1608 [Cordyceps sp. RAO-2017]
MTEPENFEEDLFADLYDDHEAPKGAPRPQAVSAPPANEHDVQVDFSAPTASEPPQLAEEEQVRPEPDDGGDDDEDDDDVDFNLGGGTNGAAAPAVSHHDAPSTPPYGTVHRASAKEDG